MTIKICLAIIIMIHSFYSKGQDIFDIESQIDPIFKHLNVHTSPGFAVAVMQEGELIFNKGYGMANLEHNIPITDSSIFHIASVSKQYTAFSIVLLAQQGKLSLDDDIRKHLPYVPKFGKVITIRHLITHTSGLRDQWQALVIAGWQMDDVITQEHILKFVSKQRSLNFQPGEKMMYSNTGYTLLAEIVKKVSGQTLRQFAHENIFKPLKMSNTHFHDNYKEVIKNRVDSYDSVDSSTYTKSVLSYSTVGATSLFTTVNDEAKWLRNFETGEVGGKKVIEQMYETGVLTNGQRVNYAFGLIIDTYKGFKRIGHGGGDAGFRTYAVQFPEKRLSIIVFSNLGSANPLDKAMKIADLVLRLDAQPMNDYVVDTALIKAYTGTYFSRDGFSVSISTRDRRLFAQTQDAEIEMHPKGPHLFSVMNDAAYFKFDTILQGRAKGVTQLGLQEKYAERITQQKFSLIDMTNYIGVYHNEELDATYYIEYENGNLVIKHRKFKDGKLYHINKDYFSTSYWWMNNINFQHDRLGKVTGFDVNSDRILRLRFKKIQ